MRVFMRKDGGTLRVQPLIAVSVVEMPMGVDQVFDRIAAEAVDNAQNAWAGHSDSCIDEQLAVGTWKNSDIATRAFNDGDITPEFVDLEGRFRRVITNRVHDISGLGVGFCWR